MAAGPRWVWIAALLVWAAGTAEGTAAQARDRSASPCFTEQKLAVRRESVPWHLFDVTVLSPLERSLHVIRIGRRFFRFPVPSRNLQDGRVIESLFFVDRDPASLSAQEVRWGPTDPVSLPQPPFAITKSKNEGRTAGFFVKDAGGVRYLFKLDPVGAPELLTGAEVVSSKLLHALGYHVPSYEIVQVEPQQLRIDGQSVYRPPRGAPRPFTHDDLRGLLSGRVRQGTMRVVASKILDGELLGPARFRRFRDCAEIRALKLAYAWLNNIDAKDHNSLLVWDGRRTVGYLIDFGTSLGADAGKGGPKSPCAGWTNVVDLQQASVTLLTFGLSPSRCDTDAKPVSAAVGLFSPRMDPDRWKPYAPNLAFLEIDEEDARWMAGRLDRVSHEQIEAAVAAGRYSDPGDAAYLVEVLEARRHAIIARYLTQATRARVPMTARTQ